MYHKPRILAVLLIISILATMFGAMSVFAAAPLRLMLPQSPAFPMMPWLPLTQQLRREIWILTV